MHCVLVCIILEILKHAKNHKKHLRTMHLRTMHLGMRAIFHTTMSPDTVLTDVLFPTTPGITDSLSKNEWADETLYEVRGCTTSTECICSEAPRKSRENLAKGVSMDTRTHTHTDHVF